MKSFIYILLLTLICQVTNAQVNFRNIDTTTISRVFSNSINIDTLIKPDYFIVSISVVEKRQFSGKRKRLESNKIDLDSVTSLLSSNLKNLGFTQNLTKTSISEASKYYEYEGSSKILKSKILFQSTLEFKVSSKDSAEFLFKNIDKDIIKSIIVTPKLNQETVNFIKEEMTKTATKLLTESSKKVLKSIWEKSIQPVTITTYMYPNVKNFDTQLDPNLTQNFKLDLSGFAYTYNLFITFKLVD